MTVHRQAHRLMDDAWKAGPTCTQPRSRWRALRLGTRPRTSRPRSCVSLSTKITLSLYPRLDCAMHAHTASGSARWFGPPTAPPVARPTPLPSVLGMSNSPPTFAAMMRASSRVPSSVRIRVAPRVPSASAPGRRRCPFLALTQPGARRCPLYTVNLY